LIARFIRFYGYDAFRNPAYPTTDKVIPVGLFFGLLGAMGPAMLAEQLAEVQAVAHGIALALNGKDPKVRAQTRKLIREAYPEEGV